MPFGSSGKVQPLPAVAPELLAGIDNVDLGHVYRQHAAQVARWAQRLLGPTGEIEDVLHEVFIVAHRRWPDFRGDAHVTTWLYAITQKVVHDVRRKRRWQRWLRIGYATSIEPATDAPTPLRALEARRAALLTYRLLDRLPEAERAVLILFELEGLSGEQIAALCNEPVGTIWVRLHRARKRFRKHFVASDQAPDHGGDGTGKVNPR